MLTTSTFTFATACYPQGSLQQRADTMMRRQQRFILLLASLPFALCFLSPSNRRMQHGCFSRHFDRFKGISNLRESNTQLRMTHARNYTDYDDPTHQRESVFSRWNSKYVQLCEQRPYPTKAVSSGVIAGCGGILCQWVKALSSRVPFVLDWRHVVSFALTGFIFEGPFFHFWYEQLFRLGRYLESKKKLSSRMMTLAQIVVDETIGVAIYFPMFFFAYEISQSLTLLRGKSLAASMMMCWSILFGKCSTHHVFHCVLQLPISRRSASN